MNNQTSPHAIADKWISTDSRINTENDLKKNLTVLFVIVFLVTLGLVALNAYQRDSLKTSQSTMPDYGPGASQAASTGPTFPSLTPTAEGIQRQAELPAPQAPVAPPQAQVYAAGMVRSEPLPSYIVIPLTGPDGQVRIKRIINR